MARIAIIGIKRLPALAGADRVVEHLLEYLPPEHEYIVFLLSTAIKTNTTRPNIQYRFVRSLPGKHVGPFVYFLFCALDVLVHGGYDIIHLHNSDTGFICPLLRLRRRVALVGTFHGDPYLRLKWGWFARSFLRVSEFLFAYFCQVLTSVSPMKSVKGKTVRFIPNGLEQGVGPSEDLAKTLRKFEVDQARYVLFVAGRIDVTKGLHDLLRAYGREERIKIPLVVVGDFTHDLVYTKLLEQLSDGLPVLLHRQLLPKGELLDLMFGCAALVFPSHIEAMSMVLLEAVASKRPVVCSDIPENVAIVGSDYPYLFRKGDHVALARSLRAALSDPDAAETARKLYDVVAIRQSWGAIAFQYAQCYGEVFQRMRQG